MHFAVIVEEVIEQNKPVNVVLAVDNYSVVG
jgi:hypothetical protein